MGRWELKKSECWPSVNQPLQCSFDRTQTIFDASVEAEIRNQVEENFGKKNLVRHCEMVKETLKNRDLVTVFEFSIGGRGSSKDIDRAILQALLRGESS